jgi:hypothetical protein
MTVAYFDTHALVRLYVGVVERSAGARAMVYGRPFVGKDRLIAQYYPHTVW